MNVKYFKTKAGLRNWYEKNHNRLSVQWIGFYRKDSGYKSITYPEALEEALCFGWIDGLKKSIDSIRYCQRFTPRKPRSSWSRINIKKAEELIKKNLMSEPGLQAFNNRDRKKTDRYSFEQSKEIKLSAGFLRKFKANKKAWVYFSSMPEGYRKTSVWWVISGKQEITQIKRLDTLITDSEAGRKIGPLRNKK